MKTIIQSLVVSMVIHLIYIIGTLLVAYIKTKNYKPEMADNWEKVETLQNEVAFGAVGSPLVYLFSFLGVALICGIIIIFYRKIIG